MTESSLAGLERLFLSLSDRTRLKLLSLMSTGEVSVGFLAESIGESQPKISRHLASLRSAGLVATRREGKHIFYGILWPESDIATNILKAVVAPTFDKQNATQNECISSETPQNIYDSTHDSDYSPQEIEVFLL